MSLPEPFYKDKLVTLYCGESLALLPFLPKADAIITDPPYGETSLDWDKWPDGWPELAAGVSNQMWCFGSMRMFLEKGNQFSKWNFAQDIVWEKHNGSNSANDRFRRVHESALHFYQGKWVDIFKEPQFTYDAVSKKVKRTKNRTPHWGDNGDSSYSSVDGGPRLASSVIYSKSCHGYAVNETQKPEAIIFPLVMYSVPAGGLLVDLFAGSGTMLNVARKAGRMAIGIEKRESQCREAVKRFSQGYLF